MRSGIIRGEGPEFGVGATRSLIIEPSRLTVATRVFVAPRSIAMTDFFFCFFTLMPPGFNLDNFNLMVLYESVKKHTPNLFIIGFDTGSFSRSPFIQDFRLFKTNFPHCRFALNVLINLFYVS